MSALLSRLRIAPACYTWVESDLVAGHLIYQPIGDRELLARTHAVGGRYAHQITDVGSGLLREAGCQHSYSPYSGLDMVEFAAPAAKQIVDWIVSPPSNAQIMRLLPHDPWERLVA